MLKWKEQVAFVTGVSSGIGKAIAEYLVDNGLKVVGFGERSECLVALGQELSNSELGKFYPIAGDITNEDHIIHALQWTKNNVGPISILINNAGDSPNAADSYDSDTQILKEILNVTILGVFIVSREAIKHMKENNIAGHIININSVAMLNFSNNTISNLYSSINQALTALTETLRLELDQEQSGIRTTSLSHGLSESEFSINNSMENMACNDGSEDIKTNNIPFLKPSDIAEAIIFILSTPKYVNISKLTIQPVGEKF